MGHRGEGGFKIDEISFETMCDTLGRLYDIIGHFYRKRPSTQKRNIISMHSMEDTFMSRYGTIPVEGFRKDEMC